MCYNNEHLSLIESTNAQISWCKGCKSFSVIYKSSCLTFIKEELKQFHEVLRKLRASDFHYNFFGEPQIIIKNEQARMGMCLNENEFSELKDMVGEALTMKEVFEIIYN